MVRQKFRRLVLSRDRRYAAAVKSDVLPPVARERLLNRWGVKIGEGAFVEPGSFFGGPDVTVGAGTFINRECFLDASAPITIGERCNIGMQVMLCTSVHDVAGRDRRAQLPTYGKPVTVGDGCWIGARATILPGVSVAPGCVVAAGAVVAEDTEPDGVYAGVPAKRIKDLP